MADLKISQFVDGGSVQTTDEIATNRAGINTKVSVGTAASLDAGGGIGDVITWQDDGGGIPRYPAGDGSQITGIETSADLISYTPSSGSSITADNVQDAIDELESDLSALGGVVNVTTNDTTPGVLNDKLLAGTGITKTLNNPAGNETLTFAADFSAVATAAQGAKADTAVQPGIDGSYTPTLSIQSNITSIGVGAAQYVRLGNLVVVWGRVNSVEITSTASRGEFLISLPIAVTISSVHQSRGFLAGNNTSFVPIPAGVIIADSATNSVRAYVSSPDTTARNWEFMFQYRITD